MKKIILSLLFGLILVLVPAGVASAETDTGTWKEEHCYAVKRKFRPDLSICFKASWRTQSDGTGIRVEHAYWRVRKGCMQLEAYPQKGITSAYFGAAGKQWERGRIFPGGRRMCSSDFDLEIKVDGNSNKALFTGIVVLNLNNAKNREVGRSFYICKKKLC